MGSTPRCKSPQRGGRGLLAAHSIQNNKLNSQRRAAHLFNVPLTSLQRRLKNVPTIAEFNARKRKLSLPEEQSLV
jgi:hypothetical protein